jgi:excisionase family DNA binding protein
MIKLQTKPKAANAITTTAIDAPARIELPAPAVPHAAANADTPAPPFLSLQDAADWLGISLSTIKRLIANGDIATLRVGERQRIPAAYLERYVMRDILVPE